jgi:hypothetical protein
MTINLQDELKNLGIFLSNIINPMELYDKRRDYHNSLLNGFSSIESDFSEKNEYSFYNDEEVRKRVKDNIEELFDVLDCIYEDIEFKGLKEDIVIFKYLLVGFEKKIKNLL